MTTSIDLGTLHAIGEAIATSDVPTITRIRLAFVCRTWYRRLYPVWLRGGPIEPTKRIALSGEQFDDYAALITVHGWIGGLRLIGDAGIGGMPTDVIPISYVWPLIARSDSSFKLAARIIRYHPDLRIASRLLDPACDVGDTTCHAPTIKRIVRAITDTVRASERLVDTMPICAEMSGEIVVSLYGPSYRGFIGFLVAARRYMSRTPIVGTVYLRVALLSCDARDRESDGSIDLLPTTRPRPAAPIRRECRVQALHVVFPRVTTDEDLAGADEDGPAAPDFDPASAEPYLREYGSGRATIVIRLSP